MNQQAVEVIVKALRARLIGDESDARAVLAALEAAGFRLYRPVPVRSLNTEWNADAVQMVWDSFVAPYQDEPPSVEMRVLTAILRSVYAGLVPEAPDAR